MKIIFQLDSPAFTVEDRGNGRLVVGITVQGVTHFRMLEAADSREMMDALVLSSAMRLQLTPDSQALAEWRQHVAQTIARLQCDIPDWPGDDDEPQPQRAIT